jgi:hypothetical protein
MKTRASFLAVASVTLALAACGGSDTTTGGNNNNAQPSNDGAFCATALQPTFSDIHTKVLVAHCAGCHGAGSARGAFADSDTTAAFNALKDATPNNAAASAAGWKRVHTGDSATSLIVWKLDPANASATTYGSAMPFGANPSGVCAQNLDAIKQWIDGGAQND